MTTIKPISDLHLRNQRDLDYYDYLFQNQENCDILLCAGDITTFSKSSQLYWNFLLKAGANFQYVIFIKGNHELYDMEYEDSVSCIKELAAKIPTNNVLFLDRECFCYKDIVFIGATLWSLFEDNDVNFRINESCESASKRMLNDLNRIYKHGRLFTPSFYRLEHQKDRWFLEKQLFDSYWDQYKKVVLTHHAPIQYSNDPRFENSPLTGAFTNSLEDLIANATIHTWVHGHIHYGKHYDFFNTQVVNNPLGKRPERTFFDDNLVLNL